MFAWELFVGKTDNADDAVRRPADAKYSQDYCPALEEPFLISQSKFQKDPLGPGKKGEQPVDRVLSPVPEYATQDSCGDNREISELVVDIEIR